MRDKALAASWTLEALPNRGHLARGLRKSRYRELFVEGYRLIYKVIRKDVVIAAFVHGAREHHWLWSDIK